MRTRGKKLKVPIIGAAEIASTVVGTAVIISGRRKRTEFLFEQARLLDSDPDISEAIKILEERHQSISLEEVFEGNKDYLQKFDELFNFLDRIAYATVYQKTLSIDEVVNFGWYLRKIKNKPLLVDYCNNNGFSDIIKLAEKIVSKENVRRN